MNALLGTHKVAVSSHPGRTKHYQTHYMTPSLMLCDCPGLVFPRLDVSLPMQASGGGFARRHVGGAGRRVCACWGSGPPPVQLILLNQLIKRGKNPPGHAQDLRPRVAGCP